MKKILTKSIFILLLYIVYIVNISSSIAQTTPTRWTYASLSKGKIAMGAAALGNKIMFYSGSTFIYPGQQLLLEAELFDINTGQSQILPIDISAGRIESNGIGIGSKFIFAGGDNGYATDRVDTYDTVTNTWFTTQLSLDRYFMAAVSLHGKALFVGGLSRTANQPTANVDIYTEASNSWNTINLPAYITGLGENSPYRRNIGGIAYGTKAYFAGGIEGVYEQDACQYVSVFDGVNNIWLPSLSLSNRKYDICTGAYNGKVYFAGGTAYYYDNITTEYHTYPSDTMNVYDTLTGSMNAVKIPKMFAFNSVEPDLRPWVKSVQAGCKLFLIPQPNGYSGINGFPDTLAIYDMARNIWAFEPLPNPRSTVTPIACKNKVYFAGGDNNLQDVHFKSDIDIYNLYPILKTSVNNTFTTAYNYGLVENNTQQQIDLEVSNEGDYDLLFDPTATYDLTGDLAVFSIDGNDLPSISDTLAPAKILSIPISFNPITSGNYSATLTIKSNDPAIPIYSFQVRGTSAENVPTALLTNTSLASFIKLYPNPTKGTLTIANSGVQIFTQAEIVNPQGVLLKEITLNGASTTVDVSELAQGIYFIRLLDASSATVVKLVKE